MKSHPSVTRVANHSRSLRSTAVALALTATWAHSSRAAEPSIAPPTAGATESYALPLALSYLLAPALALGAGGAMFELTDNDGLAATSVILMFGLPPLTHTYHADGERGIISLGSMLGFTLGGVIAGGLLGFGIGSIGCEGNSDSDACNSRITKTVIGAVTGGIAGYAGNAIYDVTANSSVAVHERPPPQTNAAQVWVLPLLSPPERAGARGREIQGVQLGVSLSL